MCFNFEDIEFDEFEYDRKVAHDITAKNLSLRILSGDNFENTPELDEYLSDTYDSNKTVRDRVFESIIKSDECAEDLKSFRLVRYGDKYDDAAKTLGRDLLLASSSAEYHKGRGYLDTKVGSRIKESQVAEIFPGATDITPSKHKTSKDVVRIYNTSCNYDVIFIPSSQWGSFENTHQVEDLTFQEGKMVVVFESEIIVKIAGIEYTLETSLFKGKFIVDKDGHFTKISDLITL